MLQRVKINQILFLFLAITWILPAQLSALTVTGGFDPKTLIQGEQGRFTVSCDEIKRLEIALPKVDGIKVLGVRTMTRMHVTDGVGVQSIDYIYTFSTLAPGEYTMPEFTVGVEGQTFMVPESKLSVVESASPEAASRDAFLDLKILPPKVYVGQVVPFELTVYANERRFLEANAPAKRGDAFSEPAYNQQMILNRLDVKDGLRMRVISIPSVVTALKAGKTTLGFDVNISLRGKEEEDFFYNTGIVFGGAFTPERKVLNTNATIEVLPLPDTGKLISFTGGIGNFSLKQEVSEREVSVGDPITYRITVEGEGNFSRMLAPDLHFDKNWAVRPINNDPVYTDGLGFRGKRVFEYVLVPRSNQIREIPSVAFSYFNPEEGAYKEIELSAVRIKVTGENPTAPKVPDVESEGGQKSNAVDIEKPISDMDVGRGHLTPFYKQKKFFWHIPILVTCFLAYASFKCIRYRKHKHPDAGRCREFEKRIRHMFSRGSQAIRQEEPVVLLDAVTHAFQLWIAFYRDCKPESLTYQEIAVAVEESDLPDQCKDCARNILTALNAHRYATLDLSLVEIQEIFQQMKFLEKSLIADMYKHSKNPKGAK